MKLWLERLAGCGIGALVLFAPLAFGSVETWAIVVIETAILAIGAVWIATQALGRNRSRFGTGLEVPILLFVGIATIQVVPWPASILSILSPRACSLYERTVPGYALEASQGFEDWLLASDAARTQITQPPTGSIALPVSYAPPVTRDRILLLATYALLFFVAADRYRDTPRRRRLVVWMVFVGVGVAIVGVFQKLAWNGKILWFRAPATASRPFGPFVNSNHFAGYMELIVPLALGLLLTLLTGRELAGRLSRAEEDEGLPWTASNRRPKAVLLGFLVALSIASIILSLSRGGFIATLVTFAVFAPLLVPARLARRSKIGLVGGVIAFLVLVLGVTFWVGASAITERAATLGAMRSEPSFVGRLQTWERTLDLVKDHTVLGAGLGAYETAYSGYYPPGTYAIWRQAHNDYLQLLAEVGVAGMIPALLALCLFVLRHFFPAVVDRSREDRYVTLGLAMAIFSMLLHSFVDFNLQVPAVALYFVLIGAMLVASSSAGTWEAAARELSPLRRRVRLFGAVVLLALACVSGVAGTRRVIGEKLASSIASNPASWDPVANSFPRFADAQRLAPRQPIVLSALGDAALAAYDRGRDEAQLLAAERVYQRLTSLMPLSAWGWWGLGEVYARRSVLDRGRQPIALDSLMPEREEDLDRAARLGLAAMRTAILLEPNSYQIHDDIAYLLRDSGLRSAALEAYRSSARIMPLYYLHDYPDPSALPEDVYNAIAKGMEEALANPEAGDPAEIWQKLGEIAEHRADLAASGRFYRLGLDAAKTPLMEGSIAWMLGNVLMREGKPAEAVPLLERATRCAPVAWRAWTALGQIRDAAGDTRGALEALRTATSLAPEDEVWPEVLLAQEMARTGDRSGAILKLRYRIGARPPALEARERLVAILREDGRNQEARSEAQALVLLAPSNTRYKDLLAELTREAE